MTDLLHGESMSVVNKHDGIRMNTKHASLFSGVTGRLTRLPYPSFVYVVSRSFADSKIRHLWFSLLFVVAMLPAQVHAGDALPVIRDLREEAQLAQQQRLPLLVLFSTDYCELCAFIKANYLVPMRKNVDYRDKVIVRELPVTDYHTLRDFDGRSVAGEDVSRRYSVDLIPTVVLMDHRGRQLAPSLVGLVSQDYYDAQLDQRIDLALRRLGASQ